MTTPSLPDQADEPTQQGSKTIVLVIGAVLVLVITMVVLHVTGIVG